MPVLGSAGTSVRRPLGPGRVAVQPAVGSASARRPLGVSPRRRYAQPLPCKWRARERGREKSRVCERVKQRASAPTHLLARPPPAVLDADLEVPDIRR
ncbi:unnamed protein product [Urochloa humidicola]